MPTPRARWWFPAAAAVLLGTTLPYAWAAWTVPAGSTFVWGLGFLPDTLGNLIFARQAAHGAWLFADTYTAEPHPARFFNLYFLLVGWTQRWTGWPPGVALQAWRLISAAALLHAVACACAAWVDCEADRRWAFLLVVTSGGFGWLAAFVPWFQQSADLRGAELTTFFSLYQQGHFAAALALLLWTLRWFAAACLTGSWRAGTGAAVAILALVAVHPYDAPVALTAGLLFAAWVGRAAGGRGRAARALVLLVAGAVPLLGYEAWVAAVVPVYREFARQGLQAGLWPLADYALGWGPLLPLAALGAREAWRGRRERPDALLPLAWLVAVPLVVALPLPARRKLLEGTHLFLALLAARSLPVLRARLGPAWRPAALAALVLMGGSGLYVMGRDVYAVAVARRPDRDAIRLEGGALRFPYAGAVDRLFFGDPWLGGLWLRRVDRYDLPRDLTDLLAGPGPAALAPGTAVLAAPDTGLFVPILSAGPVVAGHLFETLDAPGKELGIRMVMDAGLGTAARRLLLAHLNAGAILLDDRLAALGDWRPAGEPWLTLVARAGADRWYAVAPLPPAGPADGPGLRADVAASAYKIRGLDLLAAGDRPGAADALTRALSLRPADRALRALVSAARRPAPAPPPR